MNEAALERALAAVDGWGAGFAAAAVLDLRRSGYGAERGGGDGPSGEAGGSDPLAGIVASHGATDRVVRVASITKLATAWAVLLAVEEGATSLEEPLGPPGSTVRHLLAHSSGLDFETDRVLAAPGTRRIYSNTGYELLARHVSERSGIPFDEYLHEGVLAPLGMAASELRGSPAAFLHSSVEDLVRLASELRHPQVLARQTGAEAIEVQFPGLAGVLPGWGRQDPCDWGLGPELKGSKHPHWTGATAPAGTYGHFGGAGTFMWIDPRSELACVVLTDRPFDDWAVTAWPPLSDAVRAAFNARTG